MNRHRMCLVVASLGAVLVLAPNAAARSAFIRDGAARFEVLTPTMIRMEYAQDGRFENRPTMTAVRTGLPVPAYSTSVVHGWRVIRTARITLRYKRASGPFTPRNVALTLGTSKRTLHPDPTRSPGNLGGWRRALDLLSGPVALNNGLLSRDGWYVLDDTSTVLLTPGSPGFAIRPRHSGAYQDLYLFAYGHDYARALRDLRALTGPAPLLPRSAFGVWFSRYWPYSEQDYHDLLAQFRAHSVPLDTLSIDTDFKREGDPAGAAVAATIAGAPGRPYSWNGWEWNTSLFPDPKGFLGWAHSQGLSVTLNIHPSINTNDPQWPATDRSSGGLAVSTGQCRILQADPTASCDVFDWTKPRQIDAYFALHRSFDQSGADFYWLDWCCDASSASAPGLTADTWINSLYARHERERGLRWLAFARIGASYVESAPNDNDGANGGTGVFAEHRYSMQFTGDTCATWPMLAFEAQVTAEEGTVGLPYVSHDIGSFNGQPQNGQCSAIGGPLLNEHLPDDLYARWVQFGTFQPLDRLHSNHGDRLPWQYGTAADASTTRFLQLRERLNPYIYTLARRAYDTGLPIAGPLYLSWPTAAAAYRYPSEYTFGSDMVVAPVTAPGDPAPVRLWIPPGTWIDYFTGRRLRGPAERTLSVPLSQMPVLVRAGAIIPTEPFAYFTSPAPRPLLIVSVFPGARGSFKLYEDQARGFGYTSGKFTWTTISHAGSTVTIGPARGGFPGARRNRSWVVSLPAVRRPRRVTVNGRSPVAWSYDRASRMLSVSTGSVSTRRTTTIRVSP